MNVVYWTVIQEGKKIPHSKEFSITELKEMLSFMADLRKRQYDDTDSNISHITSACENPDHVGKMGVSDVKPGYNWKKRRI
jgi:hypothetical protein